MAEVIVFSEKPQPKYFDRESKYTREEIEMKEKGSTTVYVGKLNQSPPTTESQIYSTFSQCGPIKRIVMGVRKETYEPAGFCFIEFCTRDAAIAAIKWMNETLTMALRKADSIWEISQVETEETQLETEEDMDMEIAEEGHHHNIKGNHHKEEMDIMIEE